MRFWLLIIIGIWGMTVLPPITSAQPPSREMLVRDVQRRVVKIYGAGGISGLEAYQSGFLVSPEGHIATTWSYVLDVDPIVVLDDGRRFEAEIVGFEPRLELAVLKIEQLDLPYFQVNDDSATNPFGPVLAVSNLFSIASGNESASVLQGYVAAETQLEGRRESYKSVYDGPVYVLDIVTSNPGAGGGALVDVGGRLIGMLGKELRDEETGVWLNYAIPTRVIRTAISDIVAGRVSQQIADQNPELPAAQAQSLEKLGLIMVPNVLAKTPAFIDTVLVNTPAAKVDLRSDDLVLLVNGKRVDGQQALLALLKTIDDRDPLSLTVQRDRQVITVTVKK